MLYNPPTQILNGGGSVVVNSDGSITVTPASGTHWNLGSGALRGPDGSAFVPTYSFASAPNAGMWWNGSEIMAQGQLRASGYITTGDRLMLGGTSYDVQLHRDAANVLALRNSANPQAFRLYNAFTDASNYERGYVRWNANRFEIGTEAGGTGASRNVLLTALGTTTIDSGAGTNINSGGSLRVGITGGGASFSIPIIFSTDNTYDIGALGATRPRTGYFGTDVVAGRQVTAPKFWVDTAFRVSLTAPASGVLTLLNNAESDFSRLQFGGTTSSFPAIKRNGAGLDIVTANDGAYAPIVASTVTATSNVINLGNSLGNIALSAGNILLGNSASNTGIIIAQGAANPFVYFGGLTASFPALKRNGAAIDVRLADDSAYAGLASTGLDAYSGANRIATYDNGPGVRLGSGLSMNWSNSATSIATLDTGLSRASAGVVKVTNGASGNGAFFLGEIADPAAPSADAGILYVRDNGAGKSQLCVRFPSGTVQVIATEP